MRLYVHGFICCFALAALCGRADGGAPSSDALVSLRATAVGDDVGQSIGALRQLSAAGNGGAAILKEIVPQLFARDAATIESQSPTAAAQLPKLRAAEAQVRPLRAQALAAIENLTMDPESLKAARRNFAKLSNLHAALPPIYATQMRVAEAFARRAECFAIVPTASSTGETTRVTAAAASALGMSPDVAQKFVVGPLEAPKEDEARELWLYIASRRIEAWNKQLSATSNAAETTHLRRVNSYRELLGLLPFELDARLVQSARRHSKEMIDLWYFSHFSPTESERSPFTRMARAGYQVASNENITMGSWTGEEAFQQFFNSPEHHRAWISREDTAMGVGKWENAWTEDIGAGPRLMTTSERPASDAAAADLKPQAGEQTRQHPRDLSTVKFYDELGQEVKAMPGAVEVKQPTRKTGEGLKLIQRPATSQPNTR